MGLWLLVLRLPKKYISILTQQAFSLFSVLKTEKVTAVPSPTLPPLDRWYLRIHPEPLELKRGTGEGIVTAITGEWLQTGCPYQEQGSCWRRSCLCTALNGVDSLLTVCFFCHQNNCLLGWKSSPWSWINPFSKTSFADCRSHVNTQWEILSRRADGD